MSIFSKLDFTLSKYRDLILTLKKADYNFLTINDYFDLYSQNPYDSPLDINKFVILRHDVDRKPENSLKFAKIENSLGVSSTYYFRTVENNFKPNIIKKIVDLNHELGYHYENMTTASGNYQKALDDFKYNLALLRQFYPVKNICMHGSPISRWDSRSLWKKYNYSEFGIVSEPYFDIDYDKIYYITDTGRQWNNKNISIRDKVKSKLSFEIDSTDDLIQKIQNQSLHNKIFINAHPHRWFNFGFGWINELIMQNIKNIIKILIVKSNE